MSKVLSRVFKNGNSQAISLNKTILTQAGLKIGDDLDVQIKDSTIIFTKREKTLKDEIQDFYRNGGQYSEHEVDYGEAEGEELW